MILSRETLLGLRITGYVTGKEVIVISVHSMQIDCNLFAHYSEIVCGASTVPIHCPGGQGVSE